MSAYALQNSKHAPATRTRTSISSLHDTKNVFIMVKRFHFVLGQGIQLKSIVLGRQHYFVSLPGFLKRLCTTMGPLRANSVLSVDSQSNAHTWSFINTTPIPVMWAHHFSPGCSIVYTTQFLHLFKHLPFNKHTWIGSDLSRFIYNLSSDIYECIHVLLDIFFFLCFHTLSLICELGSPMRGLYASIHRLHSAMQSANL